jgi:hypothetical protein
MSRRSKPFLILAALELAVFGPWAARMGFYHDDWINLERLANAGGLWGGVKYYAGLILERPVEALHFPLLFALGGLNPLPYQLFYLAAEILAACLLYELLSRLTKSESLSLLCAALVVVFPTHAVTHLWLSSSALIVTANLTLASLLLHLRWIEERRTRDLLLGQALYLVGVLNYEVAAFLPLMLFGALLAREGRLKEIFLKHLPYAASLGLALLWQRAVVSLVLHRNPRAVGFSAAHAFKAYQAGLECVLNRAVDVMHRMIPVAWSGIGAGALLGALVIAALAAWAIHNDEEIPRPAVRTALGAAAGCFVGAVAPFAASADYMPMVFGVMSRTNGLIAMSAGILWACALALALANSRARAALLGLLVFSMTLADWGSALQWARAWTLQQEIVAELSPKAKDLPKDSVILLEGVPATIEPGGALAFGAHWDIGPALRLATGRHDLAADAAGGETRFTKDAVEVRAGIRYAYPVYAYPHATKRLEKLDGPPNP